MPDFPEIGCGAIAQYPSSYEIQAPAVIQHYVDGSEQRFASHAKRQRIWRIGLQRLSEADAVRVREFYASVAGRTSGFRFRDPWTGTWFEPCWFKNDSLVLDHWHDDVFAGEIEIYTEDE